MPDEPMASCLYGFGGKSRACVEYGLHEFLPKFTNFNQIYVEPFCFTCAMFFNSHCKSAVLNDKNEMIWNFWDVIQHRYAEFEKEMEYVWCGEAWFKRYQARTDPIGKAVFFYLASKVGHGGLIAEVFKYRLRVGLLRKDLSEWKAVMDNMTSLTIWGKDYREVYDHIMKSETETFTFVVYADPPYVQEGKNYIIPFTEADHRDLAARHAQLKDDPRYHIFVSYDDDPLIRKLYKGWHILEVTWRTGAKNRSADEYHELLISNRPLVRQHQNRSLDVFVKT